MPISLGYTDAQAVAHGVRDELEKSGFEPLYLLPYNRHDPKGSTWWVSPSPDNPAYCRGKYAFTPNLGDSEEFFCGMHIEKGFGPKIAPLMATTKAKRQLMNDNWLWHRFVSDLKAGKMDGPAREMTEAIGDGIRVVIQAYYCEDFGDGRFDPYDTGYDWDQIIAIARGAELTFDAVPSRTDPSLLTDASKATTFADLGRVIESVPDDQWVWINFWIGHNFDLRTDKKEDECWRADSLCAHLLKPLRPWFE